MKKLLSLVLSFSIILSSLSPAFAQFHPRVPRGKAPIKSSHYRPGKKGPHSFKGGAHRTSTAKPLPAVTHTHIALSKEASFRPFPESAHTLNIQRAFNIGVNNPDVLSLQQVEDALLNGLDLGSLSAAQVDNFYLSGIIDAVVDGGMTLTPEQLSDALSFYTDLIKGVKIRTADETFINQWAQEMGAVTNIGLLGEASDVATLWEVAKQNLPDEFIPVTDIALTRAFLNLKAYDKVQELLDLRLQGIDAQGRPLTLLGHWQDIQDFMTQAGHPLHWAEGRVETAYSLVTPEFQRYILNQYHPYSYIHTNAASDVTRSFLELRSDVEQRAREAQTGNTQRAVTNRLSSGAPLATVPNPSTNLSHVSSGLTGNTSNLLYSSFIPLPRFGVLTRTNARSRQRDANAEASYILSKTVPAATQLRGILESRASITYKKEALVRLYERWFFADFLNTQPAGVKEKITQAPDRGRQGDLLYAFFETGQLDASLQAITDVSSQHSLLDELNSIVKDPSWRARVNRAYEEVNTLPFDASASRFAGVVPVAPEENIREIQGTFRDQNFAQLNKDPGRALQKAGTYYKNNIPFYFRNAKGQLSEQPVGILSQPQQDFYGRMFSFLKLAPKPGFTVPEGFVLALTEMGHWEFVLPKGNMDIVERNKKSLKILEEIQEKGSYHVNVDTPYSTTNLLAMAHMLEHNPNLNLELRLNEPHSMKWAIRSLGVVIGSDIANTTTGVIKKSIAATAEMGANAGVNGLSGVGYLTPLISKWAMPIMKKLGNANTIKAVYGASAAVLGFSIAKWGMYGAAADLTIGQMMLPTFTVVLAGSLLNTIMPTILKFYKDPITYTAQNLDYSNWKQGSRLGFSALISLAALASVNWTIVLPVALGSIGASWALLRNTPLFKKPTGPDALAPDNKEQPAAKYTPTPEEKSAMEKRYKDYKSNSKDIKDIAFRVSAVYASYAASLAMLSQAANMTYPALGQGLITGYMLATLFTRIGATQLVRKEKMTDDQLTGISLPLLAVTGIGLTFLPYSGPLALVAGGAGLLHYMATAVPGQLDSARMQNIVTAEMQDRKQRVLNDKGLSEEQKKEALQKLDAEEDIWAKTAAGDYAKYNSRGLIGVGAATLGAFTFADLGPQWTQDVLSWMSTWLDSPNGAIGLNRIIFGYSAAVASVLAWKNRDMFKDFLSVFKKRVITEETITAGKVSAATFGLNPKNADLRFGKLTKDISKLNKELVDYGNYSEFTMTENFNRLVTFYNRLVALSEIVGPEKTAPAFNEIAHMITSYDAILQHGDFSVMLNRAFKKLKDNVFDPATGERLTQQPTYIEEGTYALPKSYELYESARTMLGELDHMTQKIMRKDVIDYNQFTEYVNKMQENIVKYQSQNPADAVRTNKLTSDLYNLCITLARADQAEGLLRPLATDTPAIQKAKQNLHDMLQGIVENF